MRFVCTVRVHHTEYVRSTYTKEDGVGGGCEHWFTGLDDLAERYGTYGKKRFKVNELKGRRADCGEEWMVCRCEKSARIRVRRNTSQARNTPQFYNDK